ncbi:MAG TPA: hypothetical protein PK916_05530 [Bacteroidota bacterium]|nr:hypothetical protein [Bacteroidota bacterium]
MTASRLFIIALLSATLLGMELIWTRIFSAEFLYTFAFLILSSAVLGLGLGALLASRVPLLRRAHGAGMGLLLTGLAVMLSPPLVFLAGVDLSQLFARWSSVLDTTLAIVLLALPFIAGGASLAILFRSHPRALPRAYMADMFGAAIGVVGAVVAMNLLGTPVAAAGAAIPVLIAAMMELRGWQRAVPLLFIAACVPLSMHAQELLRVEREQRAPVSTVYWDAMAKVKVYDYSPEVKGIEIDNAANSPVYAFDGNWDRPDSLRFRFGIDVGWLMGRMDSVRFLSIGAGGGTDVLQALQYRAMEVHAVEVVGSINAMMREGVLRKFSGDIYNDPRVRVVTDDARSYVRRHTEYFDMMYSLSSNTFAALASGAFAMAENYLFTTEAFEDYWEALSPRGYLMMEHQVYVPRLVSSALDAMRSKGVTHPERHIAVYNLPSLRRQVLLLSKQPLDEETPWQALGPVTPERDKDIQLVYPPDPARPPGLISRIVREGWRQASDTVLFNLEPCTDDRPYIAQLGMWNLIDLDTIGKIGVREMLGFPVAKVMCLLVAGIALLLLPLTLLPAGGREARLGAAAWYYFLLIGMGYMAVEVLLIQRYALFLGATVYSGAVVLVTMLLASGLGSRLAPRIDARILFTGLIVLLLLEALLVPSLTQLLGDQAFELRILVAVLLLAPLGLFMGMPFTKAGLRIGARIDKAMAVNGVASVIGSALVLLAAFEFGMTLALLGATLVYVVAGVVFSLHRLWPAAELPSWD